MAKKRPERTERRAQARKVKQLVRDRESSHGVEQLRPRDPHRAFEQHQVRWDDRVRRREEEPPRPEREPRGQRSRPANAEELRDDPWN